MGFAGLIFTIKTGRKILAHSAVPTATKIPGAAGNKKAPVQMNRGLMGFESFLIKRVACAAEDFTHFVTDEFLHFSARGAEILSGVKLFWRFSKRLAHRGCHGEA